MSSIVIPGLSNTTKTPKFYGEVKYTAGAITASSIPLRVLLVGNKLSTGAMTADGSPVQVGSADEVDTQAGAGSELAMMAYGMDGNGGALQFGSDGIELWLGAVAESAGAKAAATVAISGTWTGSGTVTYIIDGFPIQIAINPSDVTTDVATRLRDAVNAIARFPMTSTVASSTTTITVRNKGPRGNWHSIFQDTTSAPAGFVSTLGGGGASMTGGGLHFAGGTTADDPTNFINAIASTEFDRIGLACGDNTSDATNLAKWKTGVNNAAAPSVGIFDFVVVMSNDTLTNAASLTVTTLNHAQFELLWQLNAQTHPSVWAAVHAAQRSVAEQVDPDASYDSVTVPGCVPSQQTADYPASYETALGEGVTPIQLNTDGSGSIVRAITTYSRNGSNPDYRVLDTSQAVVPVHILTRLNLLWTTVFKPNNPRVEDDPPDSVVEPPEGVATPSTWRSAIIADLKTAEKGTGYPAPIISDVDGNLPIVQFNSVGKFLVAAVPVVPAPNNHLVGVSVRNVTSA